MLHHGAGCAKFHSGAYVYIYGMAMNMISFDARETQALTVDLKRPFCFISLS